MLKNALYQRRQAPFIETRRTAVNPDSVHCTLLVKLTCSASSAVRLVLLPILKKILARLAMLPYGLDSILPNYLPTC